MLTPKDLKYRIHTADIKMIITSMEHADKVDVIFDECPSLCGRMVIDGKREGWISSEVGTDNRHRSLPVDYTSGNEKDKINRSAGNFLYVGNYLRT